MRILLVLTLGSWLAGGAMAQRGGGGARGSGGGGFHGGGSSAGMFRGSGGSVGAFRGSSVGAFRGSSAGTFRGSSVGTFHGGGAVGNFGHGGFGFNRGFGRGFGFGFGFRGYGYWGGYYPYGYGMGYYPDYYGYSYPYSYSGGYGYDYPAYQPSSNVTVVYPNQQTYPANSVYVQRARPVSHDYDEYGQEVQPSAPQAGSAPAASGSPIYLVAMKGGVIRAAASYWVNGETLHYVTMEHQELQAPLGNVDRALSEQLNRERHVQFSLPR